MNFKNSCRLLFLRAVSGTILGAMKSGFGLRTHAVYIGAALIALAGLLAARQFFAALLVAAGLVGWLVLLFTHGLLRPLKKIHAATARVQDGDFGSRIACPKGIVELRKLAEAFNSMAAELASLDEARIEFFATVSHEIRNPLAALKEGLNLLSSTDPALSDEGRAKALQACGISCKRLESMIKNLLEVSNRERGIYDFEVTSKDVHEALQGAVDQVKILAEKRGMSIHLDSSPGLRAAFNWNGMLQVFENLLLNAIKYGQEKSSIVVRAVTTKTHVSHVCVSVTSTGKELPAGETSRVFERFYRGSNAGKQQGIGLGLHVVKRIIEAHQGGVAAFSDGPLTRIDLWIPGEAR